MKLRILRLGRKRRSAQPEQPAQGRELDMQVITADQLPKASPLRMMMMTSDVMVALVWPHYDDVLAVPSTGGRIISWTDSYSPQDEEPFTIAGILTLGHVMLEEDGWKLVPFAIDNVPGIPIPADADVLVIYEHMTDGPLTDALRRYKPSRLAPAEA